MRDLPFADSLPKCSQKPGLSQAGARSQNTTHVSNIGSYPGLTTSTVISYCLSGLHLSRTHDQKWRRQDWHSDRGCWHLQIVPNSYTYAILHERLRHLWDFISLQSVFQNHSLCLHTASFSWEGSMPGFQVLFLIYSNLMGMLSFKYS